MLRTAARRALDFTSLDQVLPDVDRLLAGHTTVGKWDLAQICKHLTIILTGAVDGFDMKVPWFVKLVAPLFFWRILKTRAMPEGLKATEFVTPKSGLDLRAEVEALRAAVRLFKAHAGPFPDNPFVGRMPRDTVEQFHCIHCAHHLSFALPSPHPA